MDADLSDPRAFPFPVDRVTTLETHISRLFFAGDRVYKLKKPVRLDFLDYSTLERRQHFCAEEVRLNRRLAPSVYRGVVAITRDAAGQPRVGGEGEIIDYAVEMIRLPAARLLDHLLDTGAVDNDLLNRLADRLAQFHRDADAGPAIGRFGTPDVVAEVVRTNLRQLRTALASDAVISPPRLAHIEQAQDEFLGREHELLLRRCRDRRIREGHGDLHAGNICDLGDGLAIYDCIEFAPAFRCLDQAAEIAFLAMDLDRRGYRGFAGYLVHRYASIAGDVELPRLVPFYKVHYALVRAKVAAIRAAEQTGTEAQESTAEAQRYIDLATTYTLPPPLLVMCGLPGSGKSHTARRIGKPLEAVILRSDVIRKHLAGVDTSRNAHAGVDVGLYAPEMTDRTYAEVLAQARHSLTSRPVIADAATPTRARRAPFHTLAAELGVPFLCVHAVAAEPLILARLRARDDDPAEVSDADEQVYRHARERFEAPDEFAADERLEVGADDRDPLPRVLDALIAQRRRHGDRPRIAQPHSS